MSNHSAEVYMRLDGAWGFRVRSKNGRIVAQSARGFDSWQKARAVVKRLIGGELNGPITKV